MQRMDSLKQTKTWLQNCLELQVRVGKMCVFVDFHVPKAFNHLNTYSLLQHALETHAKPFYYGKSIADSVLSHLLSQSTLCKHFKNVHRGKKKRKIHDVTTHLADVFWDEAKRRIKCKTKKCWMMARK